MAVAEQIITDLGNMILPYLPETILGIDIVPFVGLVIGILIACYEGLKTKYVQFKLTKSDGDCIKFDNRYLVSGLVAIIVTYFTVDLVISAGSLNGVTSWATALFIGFTEGSMVIKTVNRRVDIFIERSARKAGLSEEKATDLANSVQFVEVDATNSVADTEPVADVADRNRKNGKNRKENIIEFEDVTLKSL